MTLEEKILAVWSADATATALVPAARFKVPGNWQDLTLPYVIQYPIAEEAVQVSSTSGVTQNLRRWPFYQLSVIAASYSSAKAIAEKMRTVFDGNKGGVQFFYRGQRWVGRDDAVNADHIAVDFEIAERLSA